MPFNFFSLPSEIRIKIYAELLVAAEIITVVFQYVDTADTFTSIFSLGFFIHDDSVSTGELDVVHAHLRSIPSLKEVKAITYERLRTAKMVDEMKNKGWIVEFTGPSGWDILKTQGMFQGAYIGFDWDIDGGDYYL